MCVPSSSGGFTNSDGGSPGFQARARLGVTLLTDREALITRELRGPVTLAEIAEVLFVARNTVKTRTMSLHRKLGAKSRAEAVALLERAGFYESPV